jgi:probable HAF family extracellular repeat protein
MSGIVRHSIEAARQRLPGRGGRARRVVRLGGACHAPRLARWWWAALVVICLTVRAADPIRFAIIGDFGDAGTNAAVVARMVKGWNPAFIVTLGDNNYLEGDYARNSTLLYDTAIGSLFGSFIKYPAGSKSKYAPGSTVNRFFPALGNHDIGHGTTNLPYAFPYWYAYFDLPGNKRYYDFVQGNIHFFVLDSDEREPDGITASYSDPQPSVQAAWLKSALKASTSTWNFVLMHHPPYGSGGMSHGERRWPFREWGADAVFAGHMHLYERLAVNGIPYIINGAGGHEKYAAKPFNILGSMVRADAQYGAMLAEVRDSYANFKFFYGDGTLVDEFQIPAALEANVLDRPVAASADDAVEDAGGAVRLGDWWFRPGEAAHKTVGMRFQAVNIPARATIVSAFVQFKARGSFNEKAEQPNYNLPLTLQFQGELPARGEPNQFAATPRNITSRPRTRAAVTWPVPAWTQYDEGPDERTPDLQPIIQEIVNGAGWGAGNALGLIFSKADNSGPGVRHPYAADAETVGPGSKGSGAPILHVQWIGPYQLTDLGALARGTYAYAFGINNAGDAAGYSETVIGRSVDHAFLWNGSSLAELRTPWNQADKAYAYGINDARVIIGYVNRLGSGAYIRAFRWTPAAGMSPLATLNGPGAALDVNQSGTAVGYSQNAQGVDRAVQWSSVGPGVVDLGSLAGDGGTNSSYAYAIANDGTIVGKSVTSRNGPFHAFRLGPNRRLAAGDDLGVLPGGLASSANDINDRGQIVGASQDARLNWHAIYRAPGSSTLVDLGTLGGTNSFAHAISGGGLVVGTADRTTRPVAFAWRPGWPRLVDLNELRPAGSTLSLASAEGVNDGGAIVGWAFDPGGHVRAFLLSPAP